MAMASRMQRKSRQARTRMMSTPMVTAPRQAREDFVSAPVSPASGHGHDVPTASTPGEIGVEGEHGAVHSQDALVFEGRARLAVEVLGPQWCEMVRNGA